MTKDEILSSLKNILEENFEIAPEEVTPEASLYQDLDLDSIDAVDLVVALQSLTGKKNQTGRIQSRSHRCRCGRRH